MCCLFAACLSAVLRYVICQIVLIYTYIYMCSLICMCCFFAAYLSAELWYVICETVLICIYICLLFHIHALFFRCVFVRRTSIRILWNYVDRIYIFLLLHIYALFLRCVFVRHTSIGNLWKFVDINIYMFVISYICVVSSLRSCPQYFDRSSMRVSGHIYTFMCYITFKRFFFAACLCMCLCTMLRYVLSEIVWIYTHIYMSFRVFALFLRRFFVRHASIVDSENMWIYT